MNNLKKKTSLKCGRRLGSKNSEEEKVRITLYLPKSDNDKINKIVKKDGTLSRTYIINFFIKKGFEDLKKGLLKIV